MATNSIPKFSFRSYMVRTTARKSKHKKPLAEMWTRSGERQLDVDGEENGKAESSFAIEFTD